MRRSLAFLIPFVVLSGCGLPGIELGRTHALKPEGICESRGGKCSCDGNATLQQPSPYPVLDCQLNPFTCPVVCYGASGFEPYRYDAGVPDAGPSDARLPRLMVGSTEGTLAFWNKASQVVADRAPSETLAIPTGLTALTVSPGLLTAGFQNGDVAVFDFPRSLGPASTPRATVHVAGGVMRLVPEWGDLFVLSQPGTVGWVKGVFSATSASTVESLAPGGPMDELLAVTDFETIFGPVGPTAELWHVGVRHDQPGGPIWIPETGTTFTKGAAHLLAIGGATLFAADDTSGDLQLMLQFRTVLLSGPGTFQTLSTGLNRVSSLAVVRDVAIVGGVDAMGQGTVALYVEASALTVRQTKPTKPDQVITHASLGTPIAVALGADFRLYVLDADGISIFKDVKTKPTFVTEVKTGIDHPRTLNLIE